MDLPALLRTARRLRRLSQRELCALAQLPQSTLERIEAGHSDPRIGTVERLLGAIGLELGVHVGGQLVRVDPQREGLVDFSGRHFPAHWEVAPVDPLSSWWGWARKYPKVRSNPPSHTYWRRGQDLQRWQDAT